MHMHVLLINGFRTFKVNRAKGALSRVNAVLSSSRKLSYGSSLKYCIVMSRICQLLLLSQALGLLSSGSAKANATTTSLHLLSLLPNAGDSTVPSPDSEPAILPAVKLALEHVNRRSDFLRGFKLDLVSEASGCDAIDEALLGFVRRVLDQRGSKIAGIVGPRCSSSVRAVAYLVNRERLALINLHLGMSSELPSTRNSDDEIENKYSFGILGSTPELVQNAVKLVQAAKWKRMAVLYEASNRVFYQTLYKKFSEDSNNFSLISIPINLNGLSLSLIRESKMRVVVMFLNNELANLIACLAFHNRMIYPTYQWLWVARSLPDFNQSVQFTYERKTYICSAQHIFQALEGSIFLNYRLIPTNLQQSSISGLSYEQFYKEYQQQIELLNVNSTQTLLPSQYAPVMYDAVWTLALAFNQSISNLSFYEVGMPQITNLFAESILSTKFNGVSGHIDFDSDQKIVNRLIDIYVFSNNEQKQLSIDNASNEKFFIADHFPNYYPEIIPALIYAVLGILMFELVLAVVTHCVTIYYRKEKSIRAVSIKLNNFVFLGSYLFIAGTFLYLLIKRFTLEQHAASIVCHLTWPWVLSIGFTFIIGTVTARMWRVYRIFVHYRHPGPFISDKALVTIVLLLVMIDVLIATTWTVVDPIRATVISEETTEVDGAINIRIERACVSENTIIWVVLIIGEKILQLLSMLYLAIITRKIRKDFATQSYQVASYMLAITIMLGSGLFVLFFLNRSGSSIYLDFTVLCSTFILMIGICYFTILLPPVFRLLSRKYKGVKEDPPPTVRRMSVLTRRMSNYLSAVV